MYKNLQVAMKQKGISRKLVVELLGVSEKTIFNKIIGACEWKLGEALKLKMMLFPEYELTWLFASDEEFTQKG